MNLPGGFEWVVVLVIILVLFGGSKLAGLGKGMGDFLREFRSASDKPEKPGKPDKQDSDESSDSNA